MKALRYLLIVVATVSFLSVNAQGLAHMPEARMQSTSGMVYSGSSLPQAAATGVVVTTDEAEASGRRNNSGPRRERPGDWSQPMEDPIGDAGWPLAMCALAYALMRVYRRKRA